MPTKKPAPKKVAKPAAKSVAKKAAPVKKAAPAKKAAPPAKPVKKVVEKSVSKPAVKKAAPSKKVAPAPVAKKTVHAPAPKKEVVAAKAVVKKAPEKPAPEKEKPAKAVQAEPINKTKTVVATKAEPVAPAPAPAPKPVAKPKPEPLKEVKVPKTSVKTSVPYNPEYKSLEQRQEPSKSNEPLVRYNDADLAEFRELINKKLEAAKKELAYLQGLITRKDELGGDEAESRYMTMEDGSMSMEREQLSQMASRQITYIDHLEKALIRIENKTYGICRVTGKLIDKARLRAVPHATLSLEAKLGLVKPTNEQ